MGKSNRWPCAWRFSCLLLLLNTIGCSKGTATSNGTGVVAANQNQDFERIKLQAETEKLKVEIEKSRAEAEHLKTANDEKKIKGRVNVDALAVFRKKNPRRAISEYTVKEVSVFAVEKDGPSGPDATWAILTPKKYLQAEVVIEVLSDLYALSNKTMHKIQLYYANDTLKLENSLSECEDINTLQLGSSLLPK